MRAQNSRLRRKVWEPLALTTFLRDTVLLLVILSRSVTLTATETTESEAVEELENSYDQ
jgi:hypothetical protein